MTRPKLRRRSKFVNNWVEMQVEFSLEQVRELIAILNQTDITEFTLESGELKLNIRKSEVKAVPSDRDIPSVTQPSVTPQPSPPVAVPASVPSAEPPSGKKLIEITSPMVGTFYRAPAPDEAPFVQIGDLVRKGQTVCIIEAMKLMNEIEAEVAGRIVEILVENAKPIEFGQVLMLAELP